MLAIERLQVSNSMLQVAHDCPTRVVLRLLGRTGTEPNASLECGKRGHEVLANYFRGGMDAKIIFDPLDGPYRAWCEQNITSEDRRWWSNVLAIMEEWTERHPLAELPFKIEEVEIEFVLPLAIASDGTPIDYIGVLDALGRSVQTDGRVLVENKTTGKLDAAFKSDFQYDPQNTSYLWAASETLGEPVYATYLNAIQIHRLPSDNTRRCKDHHRTYDICSREHVKAELFPVTRSPTDVEEWKRNATLLAERVLKLARMVESLGTDAALRTPTLGRMSRTCGKCDYKAWCLTNNRQIRLIDTLAPKVELLDQYKQEEYSTSNRKLRSGLVKEEA